MPNLVSTVQEIYAAFSRGDVPGILARLTDDVVWETEAPAAVSFGGIRHGITETKGFFEAIARDHADPKLTMTDYVTSGDAVMAIGRYQATMKSTGKRADTPVAHYWRFRDGKVARYVGFINSGAFVEALQPLRATAG